jgi:hypothetical protein
MNNSSFTILVEIPGVIQVSQLSVFNQRTIYSVDNSSIFMLDAKNINVSLHGKLQGACSKINPQFYTTLTHKHLQNEQQEGKTHLQCLNCIYQHCGILRWRVKLYLVLYCKVRCEYLEFLKLDRHVNDFYLCYTVQSDATKLFKYHRITWMKKTGKTVARKMGQTFTWRRKKKQKRKAKKKNTEKEKHNNNC